MSITCCRTGIVYGRIYISYDKAPNTYGRTQIDYEFITFNLVKRLNTIGNFKARAEKGDNEKAGSYRKIRT